MQKIGKEVKIGLAVIGVLLVAFGVVLYKRLSRPSEAANAPTAAETAASSDPFATGHMQPNERPTVVSASDGDRSAEVGAAESRKSRFALGSGRRSEGGEARGSDPAGEAQNSFMPSPRDGAALGTENQPGSIYGRPDNPPPPLVAQPADNAVAEDPFRHKHDELHDHHGPEAEAGLRDPHQNEAFVAPDSHPLRPPEGAETDHDPNPLRHRDGAEARAAAATSADSGSRFSGQSIYGSQPEPTAPAPEAYDGSERRAPLAFQPAGHLEDGEHHHRAESFRAAEVTEPPQPLVTNNAPPQPGQYIVQPNDNYWTVSEKVYNTGGYFKAIFEHNRRQHPQADRLQVGEVLLVPDEATLQKEYPDLCPKPTHVAAAAPGRIIPASARIRPGTRVYTVEEGDTLFEIARRELGKPSRWGEIYQLNRESLGSDFDYLKPGSEILIPSDRQDPIASRPGAFTR